MFILISPQIWYFFLSIYTLSHLFSSVLCHSSILIVLIRIVALIWKVFFDYDNGNATFYSFHSVCQHVSVQDLNAKTHEELVIWWRQRKSGKEKRERNDEHKNFKRISLNEVQPNGKEKKIRRYHTAYTRRDFSFK